MVFTLWNLIECVWIILPAYTANGFAPLARGKRRVDFGRKFIDGKPLLGKGKTWEGLVLSLFAATAVGTVQQLAFPYLPFDQSPILLTIAPMSAYLGLVLGLGAMVGDMAGSFIKRRLKLPPGSPAPILDQDDFIVGALGLAALVTFVKLEWFLLLMTVTPVVHITANYIAFRLKVKNTRW
jgi:CDP-2,3-bis-(O-geranylgeranyl)-sn-glycerol synthase